MLKVFVINLEDSVERRERITNRLNELGIDFEIFPAIDGRCNPHPLFEKYDEKKCANYRRRMQLSGGELGCFASHYCLWKKCVELNEPILVLEDDLVIDESIIEALQIVEQNIDALGLMRLAGTSLHRRPFKEVCQLGDFTLVDHVRGPAGTLAYAVSPKAASLLLEGASSWFLPVDDYLDRYWCHGVDSLSLMPFPVQFTDLESDIPRYKASTKTVWMRLKHEYFGRLERLRRLLYRLFKKRPIPVDKLQGSSELQS